MNKTCATCKQSLCETKFEFKDKAKQRRSSWCKSCTKEYKKRYYHKHKKRLVAAATLSNNRRRNSLRATIAEYLSNHPCVDCGERDPVVLEFDHRNPSEKLETVCRMVSNCRPIDEIIMEMHKCDVRCANCHRRKTAKQFRWYEELDSAVVKPPRRKRRNPKPETRNRSD